MRKFYLLVVLSLLVFTCSNNDSDAEVDTYSYTYKEDSNLIIVSRDDTYMKYGKVESGDYLVFEYMFDKFSDEEIADDGYTEIIKFEIDPERETFSYSGDELAEMDIVLTKICYCHFPKETDEDFPVTGRLSGEKISDTEWHITFNLTFYVSDHRVIDAVFTLE
ncbi:hypothetical protein [Formosa haliotis]|uniref:hypothetical protein n=1 Tax=Formosa haliotis TaxID=1555194 RepID=UPI00082483DA|nr:hypothetical protein [Formosa haliotis]